MSDIGATVGLTALRSWSYNVLRFMGSIAMTKDVTSSVRIDRKLSNKLEKFARQARRSKSAMAIFAIESYLDIQDQKKEVAKYS
jgi:hypothetical protein